MIKLVLNINFVQINFLCLKFQPKMSMIHRLQLLILREGLPLEMKIQPKKRYRISNLEFEYFHNTRLVIYGKNKLRDHVIPLKYEGDAFEKRHFISEQEVVFRFMKDGRDLKLTVHVVGKQKKFDLSKILALALKLFIEII